MAPGGVGGPSAYPGAAPSPRGPVMTQQPGMPSVRPGNFLQVLFPPLPAIALPFSVPAHFCDAING